MSRSGYDDWLGRPPWAREEANTLLMKQIRQAHEQSRGTYGWPRIHAELRLGLGLEVNHKRIARGDACRGPVGPVPAATPRLHLARPGRRA